MYFELGGFLFQCNFFPSLFDDNTEGEHNARAGVITENELNSVPCLLLVGDPKLVLPLSLAAVHPTQTL